MCVASLPEHIRPAVCAFGGLADGFLPFDIGGGRTEQLHLASIVMKAVQARSPVPSNSILSPCTIGLRASEAVDLAVHKRSSLYGAVAVTCHEHALATASDEV